MSRICGITFGGLSQILFAFTVVQLFLFLKGASAPPGPAALWRDAGLALQFGVLHSLMLHPRVRGWLVDRLVPAAFYGCGYSVVTCGSLLLTFGLWQSSPTVIWQATGAMKTFVEAAYLATWVGLAYSLHLNGLGWQTGFTPWRHWLQNQPVPRRVFAPRGVYRLIRHPGYLCFMGLVWLTPDMTFDRAVLTVVWTTYIFIGSWLKDQRLVFFLGDLYREYQSRVPGYPAMPMGPLAKVSYESARSVPAVRLTSTGRPRKRAA